jgi:flagellar assembly protein FliH
MSSDQQKNIHPFTFERSFDVFMTPEEEEAIRKKQEEEEETLPTFSEEELEAARDEAFQSGLKAGLQEALTGIEQKVSATLDVLVTSIGRIGEKQTQANELISRETMELAVAAVRKLFPRLAERGGKEEVEKFISDIMSRLLEEPHLNINVSEALRAEIQRHLDDVSQRIGFTGKITISSDNTLGPADCRVKWSEGEAEKLTESILREIEALAGSLPRLEAPSMEISAKVVLETPSHKGADATDNVTLEIAEKPMSKIETNSPISSSEPMADPIELGDSTKYSSEFLSSEEPLPDVTPPKLTADPAEDSEITDENKTAPEPV